jgi:CubicO group peptidase (beta-lactamase class C family)
LKNPLNTTSTSEARTPAPQYNNQDRIFSRAFNILAGAIEQKAFPGAATAVTHSGKLVALKALGQFTFDATSAAVEAESIFDLASLTKVVATTSMAMILYERGFLDLEMPIVRVLPEFRGDDPRRREITFRQLLAHSSGLPAYERLFLRSKSKDELLDQVFSVPLKHDPETHAEYSDVGFILLGVALERIASEPLDRFCQREIFGPLAMSHTAFNPPAAWKSRIVPTADDQTFRKRLIQGEVQDENASVMGGVAAHAGLFSTASDIATFANSILNRGTPLIRPETIVEFTKRQSSPRGTSRALGWDTPSTPSQSGNYFSASSFGHLGYTGTSLWTDPERQISVTLLTNRTWPNCSNQAIKEIRPVFHDAVIKALGFTS